MPGTSFADEETYSPENFEAVEVHRDDLQKTMLGYFEPKQFIPVHAPESTLTVVVHEGEGVVKEAETDHQVSPGDVVVVAAGERRGIEASGDGLQAALVVSPPPDGSDHEKVREGLENDEWEP